MQLIKMGALTMDFSNQVFELTFLTNPPGIPPSFADLDKGIAFAVFLESVPELSCDLISFNSLSILFTFS